VEGCYSVTESYLQKHIQASGQHIRVLNLNHCYWISAPVIKRILDRCRNLNELNVIQCRLSVRCLASAIATMSQLTVLSFSITAYSDILKSVFSTAEGTLCTLRHLHLYYVASEQRFIQYVGEQATLLDYCLSLERLSIDSSEASVPELFRPVLEDAKRHVSLTSMRLSNAHNTGALMLFYGILTQLSANKVEWHSLLLPNVNAVEFVRQPELNSCFSYVEQLRELDICGSKVPFTLLDFSRTPSLLYLNVAGRILSWEQFNNICLFCRQLVSLNVHGCPDIFSLVSWTFTWLFCCFI
jgi:hypothetical protein